MFLKRCLSRNNPKTLTRLSGIQKCCGRTMSNKSPSDEEKKLQKGIGFAQAMAKFEGHEGFTTMLRKSPLVQMGDPHGKIVEGRIIHVVNDDLYIDFGTKFNCVCPRPFKNGEAYTLGKKVRLVVHDLELSTRFLGAVTDLTILEADCTLIGLARENQPQDASPAPTATPTPSTL